MGGRETRDLGAYELARACEALGAGEILLNSIDKDGTNSGFDLEFVRDFHCHFFNRLVTLPLDLCLVCSPFSFFVSFLFSTRLRFFLVVAFNTIAYDLDFCPHMRCSFLFFPHGSFCPVDTHSCNTW